MLTIVANASRRDLALTGNASSGNSLRRWNFCHQQNKRNSRRRWTRLQIKGEWKRVVNPQGGGDPVRIDSELRMARAQSGDAINYEIAAG